MFTFVSFYDLSNIGTVTYEKDHYGLSLNSFPYLSSRKYLRENLVSFMLIKVFEWLSSHYRFNLSRPDWTANSKEFFLPQRFGELSYAHFYPFLVSRYYIRKRDHTGVFFLFSDSLKMKTPTSIYLLELAKNPWDRVIMVYFDANTYITVR